MTSPMEFGSAKPADMREQIETEIEMFERYKAETRMTNYLFALVMSCFAGFCFVTYWQGGNLLFVIGGGFVAIVVLAHVVFLLFLRLEQKSRFQLLDDLNHGRRI